LGSESGSGEGAVGEHEEPEIKEQRKLQEELDALNREVQGLEIEEKRLAQAHSATLDTSGDVASLSAAERLERDERRFAKLHLTPEQLTAQITRAEKAEAALARHAEMVEAAKQERQARLEKRAKQKERLEARRERRAERKAQLKQVQAPRKGLALQDELPKATLSSGKPKAAVREVPQDIPTNVYHLGHQGGPPVLSKPEPKNTFFGKPASSATSQTPKTSPTGAEPQDAPRETAASRDPRGRRKTPAQRKSHERRTRPKHEYGNGPSQPI
jgi:hypothetical protein